jgi:hypothetical protein
MTARFDVLLETIVGLAAANMVIIETLHERRILDKTHFAHAFARAIDTLAPELRGGMVESTLHSLRDRCMNVSCSGLSPGKEWLDELIDRHLPGSD